MAQKIIVTHISPDFDGIPAIWFLKRFHPEFKTARVELIPAGDNTYNNQPVDSDEDVLHVDVGGGKFDHHHSNEFTCGAQLVYEWLIKEGYINERDEALKRMVKVITELDHGWDNYRWPEPASDRWDFSIHNVLSGLKVFWGKEEHKYIEWTLAGLDAVYASMKSKVKAEDEVEKGLKFNTRWGDGVAVYTRNGYVMDAAIKNGFAVAFTKDPDKGFVRVTGSNSHKVDFTRAYEMVTKVDKVGTWFLHASKVLLRNGSTRNPTMKPTNMTMEDVVKILEKA